VKGFRVVDESYGDIGVIQTVIEYPAQPLFQIMKGDKEILVPVIDPVIKKVDRENKTIYIDAPNGLIDLYLES
jgi:16S rRNA processing protein RimM